MPAAPPGRNKGGNAKLDRDTSKKNVALSKAKQRALAAKNFRAHQKQVKKDLDQMIKLRRSIEDAEKAERGPSAGSALSGAGQEKGQSIAGL